MVSQSALVTCFIVGLHALVLPCGAAVAGLNAVETRLIVPAWSGTLIMDFVATPTDEGWSVVAEVHARGVHFEYNERLTLHGTGTAAWIASTDDPVPIQFVGMYWQGRRSLRMPATVEFNRVSVDSNGVVTVQ